MRLFGQNKKETEEILNQWNLVIGGQGLKVNMNKVMTIRISRDLNRNVTIDVNNITVNQINTFMW
jgi:hypothetical protein